MADVDLARNIVSLLNDALTRDREAVTALLNSRVTCNKDLTDHPTIQCGERGGRFTVGVLGILNGLCGVKGDGHGLIVAEYADEELKELVRFFVRSATDEQNVVR